MVRIEFRKRKSWRNTMSFWRVVSFFLLFFLSFRSPVTEWKNRRCESCSNLDAVMESNFRRENKGFTRKGKLMKEDSILHKVKWFVWSSLPLYFSVYLLTLEALLSFTGIESFSTKLTTLKIVNRIQLKLLSLFVLISVGAYLVKLYSSYSEETKEYPTNLDFLFISGTPLQNRVGELYSLIRFVGADPYAFYYCKRCDCKSLHWLCTKGPCSVSFLHFKSWQVFFSFAYTHYQYISYRNAVTQQCNTLVTGTTKF